VPTFSSRDIERWQRAITKVASEKGYHVRPVLYTHWDDTLLLDTLDGFHGVFFIPIPGIIPPQIINRLKQAERVVVLDQDLSVHGLPSVRLFPPISVQRLLDHLESIGHRKIDCLNTQPECAVTLQRIEQWKIWMAAHGFSGTLFDEPVQPCEDTLSKGYLATKQLLSTGDMNATALFCVTAPAAIGAMRAIYEAGYRVGDDIAVCAVNGEGTAAYQTPSLTAIESPDSYPYIATCLEWITDRERSWTGPLLLQPSEVPLCIRESTVPSKRYVVEG
jgi:DNA-binding LacI/PurR family transcriptional regulator